MIRFSRMIRVTYWLALTPPAPPAAANNRATISRAYCLTQMRLTHTCSASEPMTMLPCHSRTKGRVIDARSDRHTLMWLRYSHPALAASLTCCRFSWPFLPHPFCLGGILGLKSSYILNA